MYVESRFRLSDYIEDSLKSMIPPFGYNGFGEFIFYRTYSRIKKDGGQEDWADVVTRVVNGTFSIRKDWYRKNNIHWDEDYWQEYAKGFALSMFLMQWMPPGRGLWAMGSDFVYERGSMALYNCAWVNIGKNLGNSISWLMDSLMHGVGVGFRAERDDKLKLYNPKGTYDFVIPDTREGWCDSEEALINAYVTPNQKKPRFIYHNIREAGLPIKGFGGIASGPRPLKELHEATIEEFEKFGTRPEYDSVYLKGNLANRTGCCVVAGNVRRSAELWQGKVNDPVFMNLKDYSKFPERESFGWMCLSKDSWIGTDQGPKQVWELINKPFIARVGFNNYQSKGFFSGGEKEALRITAQGFTLDASVDHKIMTPVGWVKAKELKIGDFISLNEGGLNHDWVGAGTKEEGYLLGVLIGNGSIGEDNHCHISSSLKDKGSESVRQYFSHCMDSCKLKRNDWIMPPSKIDSEEMRLSCSSLLDLAIKFGIKRGNKTVTNEIERASSNFYRGFLQGFFDTDGSIEKLGSKQTSIGIRLSQSDLLALQAVQRMLSRFNIQSRVSEVTGSEWSKKRCYILTIRSESVKWFKYHLGFVHTRKQLDLCKSSKTYNSKKRLIARIDTIEKLPNMEMFDCTVETIHAYDANGIYVSNSNNSVELETAEDFDMLGEIAKRVIKNGEPGYINRINMKFGRIGKSMKELRYDDAEGFNPLTLAA